MEMEASRRSVLDRSREPGAKKPRLTEESERDRGPSAGVTSDRSRPYAQARPAAGGSGGNPRFRASEREEREEVGRGGASYQQQQELVAQYRTALAELTFNSKPIITNLTIIAGESLHVAKSIAATVCDNVLEVPSEQKLPSLYLLDSIVKNIGGDYIKYFAARLPQVFCKAYKQVDPSIHHSLRHLFGTWKGVFPTSCLQSIENELGFQNVINGSSGGTGTRPDAQSQRTPHSIHVNPKYLEARQRFQQSTKGKEISSEDIDEVVAPIDDTERSIKNTLAGSTRQWSELSNKVPDVQHPQREQPSDFINERKGYKDLRDPGFSSQLSRQQDVGAGRIVGRVKDLDEMGRNVDQISESDEPSKPYYEAGGAAQSTAYRRNGFDANHAYGNYRALGSAPNNTQVSSIHSNRTNWPSSKNWKTSEEEEYIWDDMGSRSVDYEGASNKRSTLSNDDQDKPLSSQSRKWMSMETDQVDSRLNKFDAFHPRSKIVETDDRVHFPIDHEEHYSQQHSQDIERRLNKGAWPPPLRDPSLPALGLDHKITRVSSQTEHRPTPLGSLSTNDNSVMPRSGFQSALSSSLGSSTDLLGSGGLLAQQRQLPLRSPSPSFPSIPSSSLQQPKLLGLIDQDYLPFRSSQIGQKSSQLADQFNRDPFPPGSHDSFPAFSENTAQKAHSSSNSHPSLPLSSFPVVPPFPELKQHPSSLRQSQPDPSIQAVQNETSAPASQSKGFSSVTHSNCAIDVSGQSNISNLLASVLKTDILPNKPPSGLNIHPPLPSGPPPPQALTSSPSLPTSSAQMTSSHGITPSFTPILSDGVLPPLPPGPPPSTSLVGSSSQTANSAAIGLNPLSSLLSSLVAKGLITSASTNQTSKESSSQNSDLDASTSTPQLSSKELTISESSSLHRVFLDDNLIGIQFKTEIIRELHPQVIDSILDNLRHRCVSCGLRFRHQHQLESHLDWHNSKNSEMSSIDKVSRRWYSSISDWVSGDVEPPCGPVPVVTLESVNLEDFSEPMVTADESQCICALCGEPFEDFYSIERDEWMYKGTVYLNLTDEKCVAGGIENNIVEGGTIVHAKCISVSAVDGDVAGYN